MKAFLIFLLTVAIALGHFLATAQQSSYGYWDNGVSGEWVDALHAGPGFAGPADKKQAPPYPSKGSFASTEAAAPLPLNWDEVYRKVTLAYSRNPEGLQGIYEFTVLVDSQGKVKECNGKHPALFPFVRQLDFEKSPKPNLIKVVFDFGQIQ